MTIHSTSTSARPAVLGVTSAGAAVYVVLLAALHVVQPAMIDDATISKYALGQAGWMLQVAFIAAGVAYAGLAILLKRAAAVLGWVAACAFVVMGAFRIDSVGPTEVVSVHGALHTAAFFVVVAVTTALMFVTRRGSGSAALRILPFIAPVLVVVGFFLPGIVGALIFRAWTLSLVAWVVLTARDRS